MQLTSLLVPGNSSSTHMSQQKTKKCKQTQLAKPALKPCLLMNTFYEPLGWHDEADLRMFLLGPPRPRSFVMMFVVSKRKFPSKRKDISPLHVSTQ